MMTMKTIPCSCCGSPSGGEPVGIADETGHIWTHYLCRRCVDHCTNDDDGQPIHMLPSWDGRPETFEACRAR